MSRRQKNKKYSAELKLKAVQDYLKGGGSLRDICHKYNLGKMSPASKAAGSIFSFSWGSIPN